MSERSRFMRPAGEDRYDVYNGNWISTNFGGKSPGSGYWSHTRRGQIWKCTDGNWVACYMVGRNPERYPIQGVWGSAREAAIAVDDYSIDQGRIHNEQVAYERAHGWSTD